MKIAGVIFDFNGTLFQDTPKHEEAWQRMIFKLCGRKATAEEFQRYVHGRTNALILQHFVGAGLTKEMTKEYAREKEEIYRLLCLEDPSGFRLAEGAVELLDELKERSIPCAIATSSDLLNVEFYREHLQLERWFADGMIVYDDGTLPSKPAPDIYVRAAKRLGLLPQQCLVAEDAPSGVAAAQAAGVGKVIGLAPLGQEGTLQNWVDSQEIVPDFKGFFRFIED